MSAYGGVNSFWKLAHPIPDTIIIGGVGRGIEVQRMLQLWPDSKYIGVEPLQEHINLLKQKDYEHVFTGILFEGALWSIGGLTKTLHCNYEPDQRASLCPLITSLPREVLRETTTITLDQIREQTSPWGKTAMWMDIEGAELEAINGLSDWSEVYWINLEVAWIGARRKPIARDVTTALADRGFEQIGVHTITKCKTQADAVYVRREQWERMCQENCRISIDRKLWRLNYRRQKKVQRQEEKKALRKI